MLALLLATIIIFKTDIRPEAGCHLYLLYTEYPSLVSLFFIGFVSLPPYLFVSIKVFGSSHCQ